MMYPDPIASVHNSVDQYKTEGLVPAKIEPSPFPAQGAITMALIKPGPIVSDVRGAIGGVVFARNRSGNYARNNTKPVDPSTVPQVQARSRLSTVLQNWQDTLTSAQRDAWNDLGAVTEFTNSLGDTYNPSGVNLFIRANTLRLLAGEAIVVPAPTSASFANSSLTIEIDPIGGALQITAIEGPDPPADGDVILFRSPPKSLTINFYKGPWIFQKTIALIDFANLPVTLLPKADMLDDTAQFIVTRGILNNAQVSARAIYRTAIGTLP